MHTSHTPSLGVLQFEQDTYTATTPAIENGGLLNMSMSPPFLTLQNMLSSASSKYKQNVDAVSITRS